MGIFRDFFDFRAAKKQQGESVAYFPKGVQFNNYITRDPTALALFSEAYVRNSAVAACINILARSVSQDIGYNWVDAAGELVETGDRVALLKRPNPAMSLKKLLRFIMTYNCVGGDMYLYKYRERGIVTQLIPYHASEITPIRNPGDGWVSFYRYSNNQTPYIDISYEDIIPFNWSSINFVEPWRSIPPLVNIAKEINLDNEALQLIIALYLNGAVPAFTIEMPEGMLDANTQKTDFDAMDERMRTRFTGKNRGKWFFHPFGTKVQKLGLSMKEMAGIEIFQISETRICSPFGVPVSMVQFYSSLSNSTFSNRETDEKQFYQDTVTSHCDYIAETLSHGLQNEKFPGDANTVYSLQCDYSKVKALQESENARHSRIVERFTNNLISRDEGRRDMGLEPVDGTPIYFYQLEQGLVPQNGLNVLLAKNGISTNGKHLING